MIRCAADADHTDDYFALLDAGTDDAGRLYAACDGGTAMLRGIAEQWQEEACCRGGRRRDAAGGHGVLVVRRATEQDPPGLVDLAEEVLLMARAVQLGATVCGRPQSSAAARDWPDG